MKSNMLSIKAFINKHKLIYIFLLGFIVGVLIYIFIYGIEGIDVTNDALLINRNDDLAQHYLGWVFYRFSEWKGLGMFNTMTYPNSTSILFTDSTPILELFFKLFSPILPATFQYCGIWGLFCYGMQGGVSSIIICHFSDDLEMILVGSLLGVLSTPLLTKAFVHHAFAGQFIILIGFAYWIYNRKKQKVFWKELIAWSIIGILTCGINLYFVPIVGIVSIGYAVDLIFGMKKRYIRGIVSVVAFTVGALVFFVSVGGLTNDFQTDPSFQSTYLNLLHEGGANLNTFINPRGYSRIIPYQEYAYDYQGEGYAYVGLGIIVLFVINIIMVIIGLCKKVLPKERIKENRSLFFGIAITFLLSMIIGVGPRVCWGDKILISNLHYPGFILDLWLNFRSTGRFIWAAYYIILFGTIILWTVCFFRPFFKRIILVVVCIIQILDFSLWINILHDVFGGKRELNTFIQNDDWQYLGENYDHLVVLPNIMINRSEYRNQIAKWAGDHRITLNDFYLSRQLLDDQTEEYAERINNGEIESDTLYMLWPSALYSVWESDLHFYKIDNIYLATSDDLLGKIQAEETKLTRGMVIYYDYTYSGIDVTPVFDKDYYYDEYEDVRLEYDKEDFQGILEHFLDVGMSEGRRGISSFDPKEYRRNNKDVEEEFGDDWRQYYLYYLSRE